MLHLPYDQRGCHGSPPLPISPSHMKFLLMVDSRCQIDILIEQREDKVQETYKVEWRFAHPARGRREQQGLESVHIRTNHLYTPTEHCLDTRIMNITVKRREGRDCCVYVRRLLLVFGECGWRDDDVGFDETRLDAVPNTELNR